VADAGTLARGARIVARAIRDEPAMFAVAVLGSLSYSLLTVATAWVVGFVVGRVIVPQLETGRLAIGALTVGAGAILAMAIGRVAGMVARRLGAGAMQFRQEARYRRAVVRRYLTLPMSWHHRHATGTLLSNANADVEAAWFPLAPLPFAVGTAVMLVAVIGALALSDWVLAMVGATVLPALLAVNVGYSRRIAPRVAKAQQLRAEVSEIAHESFDGAIVVKTMGRGEAETQRFGARSAALRDAMIDVGRVRAVFDPMLDALPSLGALAALLAGAVRMRQGAVGFDEVVSASFLFTVLAFPVRAIGWVLAELPRSVVGWDRIRRVLDAPDELVYGDLAPSTSAPAGLRFKGVDFGYAAEPASLVLRGIDFEIPPGRVVALVGPTGSGKSTIATLAARLLDPSAGRVMIDGVDVRELSAASLSTTVGYVPQVPFLFDDTVRENIALGREGVDDEEVLTALRIARLDEFVAALPEGLDTRVGERGTTLSGGQRQRLTLARALAGRPRLLVLDDATSAVDPSVEEAILAGLSKRAAGTSVLIVAHRRATIALADEVIYLERGAVVAIGGHQRLLESVDGYARLVTAYERAENAGTGDE
jgi:ABC-type multidrug transport system fused ATPase/permease subunit